MTDLTRLELLRRAALGGAALSIPGFLAACGGDDGETAGTTTGESAALASTLRFSNWQLYIDRDAKKKSPSLEQFTAKSGVKVNYVEDVNDNATYFGKIQGPLSQGRGITDIDPGDNLLAKGIVDSHGVMELVAFLEERYGIAVRDEDLTPENFESVARIDEFVARKQDGRG